MGRISRGSLGRKTRPCWHLIKIETRYIADFDYRLKEEGVVEL
jgi:hypothetical protein